jgi:hypothetical protein
MKFKLSENKTLIYKVYVFMDVSELQKIVIV